MPPPTRTVALSLRLLALAACTAICFIACSSPRTTTTPATAAGSVAAAQIDGIPCEQTEQLSYHVHAHLTIIVNGQPVVVPANIGIPGGRCVYWLHTHDTSGIIHVE